MVLFVTFAQTLKNFETGFLRRFSDLYGLETAFQSGVFLNITAVFVQCGCTNHTDFTASEGGFNDICSVHGTFRRTRAYNRVQFVNEQYHITGFFDFLQSFFNAFLKFAAVFGTGNHAGQVKGQNAFVEKFLRHITHGNFSGESLCNGGFTHTGFSDQTGIVLCAAGENLNDALNFAVPADYGVKAAVSGIGGQVTGKFL